ncbi:MAG: excinuclease ABC subunit UvrA [Candidatus Caenarcaniphilales bacterium]|nr:excinuclease ABC subunit UvrA [Candidatus Caenarcaniphilales bacterium]
MSDNQQNWNQQEWISVSGAREHNLKSINVEIPKNKLVVITGVSGSGKSSLAFDTIFAEGQRRYIESLSSYARQFLGQVDKPDVDSIEGLSPAIAIDQKSTSTNVRSTVGTITEIYDHLRLLYGRIGHQHCPVCNTPVSKQTIDQIIDQIYEKSNEKRGLILAPIIEQKKGEHSSLLQKLKKDGFLRIRINGEIKSLDEDIKLAKTKKHDIEIVVDRIIVKEENRSRLSDSLSLALSKGGGFAKFAIVDSDKEVIEELYFSENLACPHGHGSLPPLSPKMFSFNSPEGACPACHGIGHSLEFDQEKLIPNIKAPLIQAIAPWAKSSTNYYIQLLSSVAKAFDVNPTEQWNKLSKEFQDIILNGSKEPIELSYDSFDGEELLTFNMPFEGVIPRLKRKYMETKNEKVKSDLSTYMTHKMCDVCNGGRLRVESLAVTVGDINIQEITNLSIDKALEFFINLPSKLSTYELEIAERVIQEIKNRLNFLNDVGLNYLTLSRSAGSLSGGESQRIRLATQIGSGLSGVLYVLDEPSIGLHQKDNDRLIETLKKLKALGNTVLVVEHDEDTMSAADWIIDVGPYAGIHGGKVVSSGTVDSISANPDSVTGRYLSGEWEIPLPEERREGNGNSLVIRKAQLNNLKNIDVKIPLGKMVVVTGVSGSGKSSLVMDLLFPYLESKFLKNRIKPNQIETIEGLDNLDKVIEIDQSPIGRTPHSNPATYTGAFTPIRELFASTPEAKMKGYNPGRFSFNVKGGRCEACSGQGHLEIEMNFLPSVYVKCSVCDGKRYNKDTLEVKYKGYSISDVLEMTVSQAYETFSSIPSISNKLKTLEEVGLGYIKLGQSATTLSGGEAQRIKLASELSRRHTGKTIYILDEPTTGLHWYDVSKLLNVLQQLVDSGNTVLIIEHNLDVIKQADWIIDLGPEGGDKGGQIIASGPPEEVSMNEDSATGMYLKRILDKKLKPNNKKEETRRTIKV